MVVSIMVLLLFCVFGSVHAQNTGKIQGNLVDTDGAVLIGANVYIKGTMMGAATANDGSYSIKSVPPGSYTLVAQYIGYKGDEKAVTVAAGAIATVNFTLKSDVLGLSEVIVTGVVNPVSKIESSVSISTINMRDAEKSAPRTTAEIFRTIPGIRSEASGGDGNTNITVRGVPISAGGSKYLQLQEDGLPVFQFGDIAFATADIFLRADYNLARIEAIRGGSASTLASNSPAGIINFISKTGAIEGGSVSTTTGLDYKSNRTDFEYGSPLSDNLSFHIGGFFRQGEGPRTAGYTANYGGQLKMNITKSFDGGYGRVYFKFLDDRAIAYMPMPLKVEGTNDSPDWGSINGYEATSGTMHSPYLLQNLGLGADGGLRRADVADGMHPISKALGFEFSRELGNGWQLDNRARLALNSGRFISPFPAEIGTAQGLAESIAGAGATLRYADGTAFGSGNAGNGLALRIHMFDTELNNFNNIVNDFKVSKDFGKMKMAVGYYLSQQSISMSWLWNSYLTDVNGEDAKMVDVYAADGTKFSQNGLYAYGVPAWGNCCQRNYDADYLTMAPYFAADVEMSEALNVDLSVRLDNGQVNGHFAGAVQTEYDVNNDGVISPNEESVSAIDNANTTPVDYEYDYVSFSFGGNYQLNENKAVFARYSRGGAAKADRLLFSGLPYADGTTLNAKDMIDQAEFGYKHLFSKGGLFVTGFMANTTEEGGYEATTQKIIENDYNAIGLEIEGAYDLGTIDLRGGVTYTKAEITSGGNDGNTPRRQPSVMYNLIPTVALGEHTAGLSLIGQTKAYAQDSNELVMPAYMFVNAFFKYQVTDKLFASVNGNNILDAIGITESEEGAIVDNQVNYVRARPIMGRSISLSLGYNFN
ncbi:MAG: TonB-dependent receptor [Calditrichaeota bacterium]|nr:MAG: TonB-dependent receptor [Calditrichota bacterium]